MEILRYGGKMAPELTETFNEAVANVPHCYSVDSKTLSAELLPAVCGGGTGKRLHSEAVFVAFSCGEILGFAHAAVEEPRKKKTPMGEGAVASEEPKRGALRFLWYRPGKRGAGQKLLEACQEYFRGLGLARTLAFDQDYRYPFYGFKHAYLSDHLGHVQALLWINGYRRVKGEVFLDWPDFEPKKPPNPDIAVETNLEWLKGSGRLPGLKVNACRDGKQIGVCECVSCGDYSENEELQDWVFTEWIGVEEKFRGRGLGRYLLRRALSEVYEVGYRNAAISTDWKNYRAFLFYSNFGYRVVDWTHAYGIETEG